VTRSVWVVSVAALLAWAGAAAADVYVLTNGDRITGRTLVKSTNNFNVQTAYGRLTIPRSKIDRIVHDDGREEIVSAPLRPPTPVHLIVTITGKTFWYAWPPPKDTVIDPTLRLQIGYEQDGAAAQPLVTYVDRRLDPREIPGALVNFFSFEPKDVVIAPAPGVQAAPPETRPGRIALRIDLPAERAGHGRLRIAYQLNTASEAAPSWVDVVETLVDVDLSLDRTRLVDVEQERGRMEYSGFLGLFKHRMKNVETFSLAAHVK
jgi:hypothetical protein